MNKRLTSLFFNFFVIPVSRMPFGILYLLSDMFYVIVYRIAGYRKKVVLTNIRNSFPGKSEKEVKAIATKFYRHFSDRMSESIKVFTISREEVVKRARIVNPELLDPYFEQDRSVIVVGGHYNNWEYLIASMDSQLKHRAAGIYAPVSNKVIQEKLNNSRSRYGMELVAPFEVKAYFSAKHEKPFAILVLSDQSPASAKRAYWMKFLHQDTAVLFGTEKYAKDYDLPVVFAHIRKVKRGYYEVLFEKVCDQPRDTHYGEITEKHTRLLEKDILEKPEYWLWSHKRWKRKRTDD